MLVPPDNFGMVEPGVYRCSKLEADHFPFLETLQLKSLVLLDAEKPPRTLRNFIESNNVELFRLGGLKITNHYHTGESSSSNKDHDEDETNSLNGDLTSSSSKTQSENGDEKDLNSHSIDLVSLDNSKSKSDQWMLIEKNLILGAFEILFNKTKHNLLLVDLTLTLVGILRKIQKWNLNSIVNEYRIYTGNSSKSNYYAQNFLELIQTELIPYEIDQLNHQLKKQQELSKLKKQQENEMLLLSPAYQRSPELNRTLSRNRSIDDGSPSWDEDRDDVQSLDDDDIDEDFLSSSPQIPANLLKLVEIKKHEKLHSIDDERNRIPGTSPNYSRSSRNSSFTNDILLNAARGNYERRRSSIDSKFIKSQNKSFRNQSPTTPSSFSSRWSFENTPRLLREKETKKNRFEDLSPAEIQNIRDTYDYKYYKNLHKFPVKYGNVGIIKLKLPPDNNLPDWFIRGRNHWEYNFKKLNNI